MNVRCVAAGTWLLITALQVACGSDPEGGSAQIDTGHAGSSGAGGSHEPASAGDEAQGGAGGEDEPAEAGRGGAAGKAGGSGSASAPRTYAVSVEVSGLAGQGLVLQLNHDSELPIDKDGAFSFQTRLAAGADYAVTIAQQPSNPGQACKLAAASGKIATADVGDVQVGCGGPAQRVGGSVTGSDGAEIVLRLRDGGTLTLSGDGTFQFDQPIAKGDEYAVTIETQPAAHSCSVANGSGKIADADITDVAITCRADLTLEARASAGSVQLGWNADGVSEYTVYVSTDPACQFETAAASCAGAMQQSHVTPPFLWRGLANGTTYYFSVSGAQPNALTARSVTVGARPNRAEFDGPVAAIAVAPEGTVYVGGGFTAIGAYTGGAVPIDRVTGLPSRMPNFPIVAAGVQVVVPDGHGGFFLGGSFTQIDERVCTGLAHVLRDGRVDEAWAGAQDGEVRALAVAGDTLYVGGQFALLDGQARKNLGALDVATGALRDWNPAPNGAIRALAVDAGVVYAGGEFTRLGDTPRRFLAALNASDGQAASGFQPDPDGTLGVSALAFANGELYVAGDFEMLAGQARRYLAALAPSGQAASFQPDPEKLVTALAVSGATVYAAGDFQHIGDADRAGLAALDADSGKALADWNPAPDGSVRALAVSADKLYVAGAFTSIGAVARPYLAALDPTGQPGSWNAAPNGPVQALSLAGDVLYVAGELTTLAPLARGKLAAFDHGALNAWNPEISGGDVHALAVANGPSTLVYAGGSFDAVGSATRYGAAAIDDKGAATRWDARLNSTATVRSILLESTQLYLGGEFSGGAVNLASVQPDSGDVTEGWALSGLNGPVRALAWNGSLLYVGGDFTAVSGGGSERQHLAAVDGNGGLDGWNPGADAGVYALLFKGETVYAGGAFSMLGGQVRSRLGAIDASGTVRSWNPGCNAPVRALAHLGSTLYAGGALTQVGSATARLHVASFDEPTGQLTAWAPGVDGEVRALAADSEHVYLGGDFASVGDVRNGRFAAVSLE